MKVLITALIILLSVGIVECTASQWLLHHNENIKGQVVEADTRKPIEGAMIIALWRLEDVVSEGPGGYDRVEVVESGKDGQFIIPAWFSFKPWQLLYKVESNAPLILIFKPGYKVHLSIKPEREGHPGDISLTESERIRIKDMSRLDPAKLEKVINDKERLESLDTLSWADFPGRHFTKNQLRKIFKSYEEEVKNLSSNANGKAQLIKNICDDRRFYIGRGECREK